MAKMTATEAAIRVMESEGVELAFGVPGAAILPLYQAMNGSKIKHVLVRHEEGGTHAAEGYTRRRQRPYRRLHRHLGSGRHQHDHRPVFGDCRQHSDFVHYRSGATRQIT